MTPKIYFNSLIGKIHIKNFYKYSNYYHIYFHFRL